MEITPELITQYGLMSKISTGNSFFDVILCLLVPALLKHLLPAIRKLRQRFLWSPSKEVKTYSRYIEYTQGNSYYWYDSDRDPPNSILQRAILNMINSQVRVLSELAKANMTVKKKPPPGTAATEGGADDDASSEDDLITSGSSEHRYAYNQAPLPNEWFDLKNGIKFMHQSTNIDDKQKNTKITYILESKEPDGNERISAFVTKALDVYRKQQTSRVDPARYLYMPVLSGFRESPSEDDNGAKPSAVYKRYKLSEEKTFSSLFHPDKDVILRLVDQFLRKAGKFAIPGYPQKLGFLLYGPPGTGKTSLIKALAQYTKRSIISVPLSKINTNQELMDIVFDNRLKLQNSSDSAISLPFDKTIFVMEDVDAASTVVQRRTDEEPVSTGPSRAEVMALAEQIANAKIAAAKMAAGGSGGGGKDSRDTASSKDGEEENDQDSDDETSSKTAVRTPNSGAAGRRGAGASASMTRGGAGSNSWGTAKGTGTSTAFGPSLPLGAFGKGLFKGDDELNLAGLLNVLDGVVDTPNRIIIMTTNHPEKLDPALIRPGRINKKIYMGRLRVSEALCMMRHYFGAVSAADEAAMRSVFIDEDLSPADLEAMCAEYDTPAELVTAVAKRLAKGADGFVAK